MTDMKNIVIVGGGHNGLVCAAYLASDGRKVTVLEARPQLGGLAATREFSPGFRVSCAHLLNLLDRRISKDLALEANGLCMSKTGLDTIALAEDGNHLTISGDTLEGGNVAARDKAAFKEYRRFMLKFAAVIGRLHNAVPPRIASGERRDLLALGKLALGVRMLGKKDMREFLRIAGINIHDILQENFTEPLLKGALSLDAVLGTHSGPRSNNSVFTALHRMSGTAGPGYSIPHGGMGAVTEAMADVVRQRGVEIRTGTKVVSIDLHGDRVCGVSLDTGEQVPAAVVISNADPKSTYLKLVGARHLEAGLVRKLGNIRSRGNASKLNLALDGLPSFTGLDPAQLGERLLIAPTVEYVERAFNHSKYGEYSSMPVAEIIIPSVHDDSLAPAGQHLLSAIIQYTPRELKGGWPAAKGVFTNRVLDLLAAYAPDIREQVIHAQLQTPQDLEHDYSLSGGHWHQGELSLDQFLMLRPVPGCAQYYTPIDGLYLCGAGCHPGGGVMGSAGRNAACVVIEKEYQRSRSA